MIVQRTFTVPRPLESVFAYLGDFTHTEEWDPGTIETTRTSGDGGLGTKYHNKSEFLGRQTELDYETVTFEEPSESGAKLQFRGNRKQIYATDSMTFTRAGDGGSTEIHYRADFDFGVIINAFAPFVIKKKIEALADVTVEQLTTTLLNRA